jgi:hypothetical protein
MQVLRMSLVEMGTPTAHLELSRTKLLPLVTLEAFNSMVREPSNLSYLGPLLFPKQAISAEPKTAEPDAKVPLGLRYLWGILHSDDKSLGVLFFGKCEGDQGACFVGEGQADVALDKMIGSGTHGIVYGPAGHFSTFVVKASFVGKIRYIETEAKALMAFSHGGSRCKYLPELKCLGKVRYTIRASPLEVPALMLSPRGIPLSQNLKIDPTMGAFAWSNIRDALNFAHDKGVFHLDVCPRNIIKHENSFLLFDWGTAGFAEQKVLGFRGSLQYAGMEVHYVTNTKDPWEPKPKNDFVSLLFTLCALKMGKSVPWPGLETRKEDEHFEDRRECTVRELKDIKLVGLAPDTKTKGRRAKNKAILEEYLEDS